MAQKIKNFKTSRQKFFILLALVMFTVTLTLIIYFVTSLAQGIETTLKLPSTKESTVQFDIQGFQKLNLTQ
jgi:uncharacterized protein YpmS